MDVEKMELAEQGNPGSSCPKQYLVANTEYTDKAICTASRRYQKKKIAELNTSHALSADYQKQYDKIVDKSCLCVGLGTSVLQNNSIEDKKLSDGVAICPGPNMAYFSKILSMKEMTDHIYGRINVISRTDRPNMFVKELSIYLEYLNNKIEEAKDSMSAKQEKYLSTFASNLEQGISYYKQLFEEAKDKFADTQSQIIYELNASATALKNIAYKIEGLSLAPVNAE
jgi:hypothetical protein